jgi:hypothetical protein
MHTIATLSFLLACDPSEKGGESGDSDQPAETAEESGGEDTDDTGGGPCVGVWLTSADGRVEDVSAAFSGGVAGAPTAVRLEDGAYTFCPGTWIVALTAEDVTVELSAAEGAGSVTLDGGGAIESYHATLTVLRSEMLDNSGTSTGGAIDLEGYDGDVSITLTDTVIEGNRGGYGGGIALWGSAAARCVDSGLGVASVAANGADLCGSELLSQGEVRFVLAAAGARTPPTTLPTTSTWPTRTAATRALEPPRASPATPPAAPERHHPPAGAGAGQASGSG